MYDKYLYKSLKEILKHYNVTIKEFAILLFIDAGLNNLDCIKDVFQKLLKNKICFKRDNVKSTKYYLNWRSEDLLNDIIDECNKYLKMKIQGINITEDCIELAHRLQQLYPKGKRPGCSVQWRGNKFTIARKLTIVKKQLHINFTDEEAINAVQRYIDSFNGVYTYMECLEYFILRERPEFKSNFISYLENNDENEDEDKELGLKLR